MGQEQSTTPNPSSKLLSSPDWNLIETKNDPIYGDVKIYQNSSKLKLASTSKVFQNQFEFQSHLKRLNKLKDLNQAFQILGLVQLLEINQIKEDHLCSQFFKINYLQEYLDCTLEQEIQTRTYDRNTIIYFMQQIVYILIELQSKSIIHGDLRPSNILIDSQNQYRLKIPEIHQYQKLLISFDESQCYLSPDQLQSLFNKQMKASNNDIFTLALVVLQMGTQDKIQEIYNLLDGTIDQAKLDSLLNKFEEKIGQDVTILLRGMLNGQVSLTQIYENLLIGSDKFFINQASPKQENNRYSEKQQKRMSPGIEKQIHDFQEQTQNLANDHKNDYEDQDDDQENKENDKQQQEKDTKQGVQISQLVSQQFKKLWGQDFLEDSDQKPYVPFNPGDNYLNEQMTLGLGCNFNCSILEQQQMQASVINQPQKIQEQLDDEVMQDITNQGTASNQKKVVSKTQSQKKTKAQPKQSSQIKYKKLQSTQTSGRLVSRKGQVK